MGLITDDDYVKPRTNKAHSFNFSTMGSVNPESVYVETKPRVITKTFPGMKIINTPGNYIVVDTYPFMVIAEDEREIKKCFTLGELVQLGMEPSVIMGF